MDCPDISEARHRKGGVEDEAIERSISDRICQTRYRDKQHSELQVGRAVPPLKIRSYKQPN